MKKILSILLVICTLLALCGCSKDEEPQASATIEGSGFKSPEKAILAYAEALQSGDVKEILSTFAIETYVDNMDMEEYLSASGYYAMPTGLVSQDDYSREIRSIQRQYQLTQQLSYMYMNHSEAGIPENGAPVPLPPFSTSEYDSVDDFIDAMSVEDWAEILEEMVIGDVLTFEDFFPEKAEDERFMEMLEKRADQYGCDEIVPLAVEITLDGVDYYLCMDVACYDGKWYNLSLLGTIGTMLGVPSMAGGLAER